MLSKDFEMGLFDKDSWLSNTYADDLWLAQVFKDSQVQSIKLTGLLYNPFAAKGSLISPSRRPIDGLFKVVHSEYKVAVFLALLEEEAQYTLRMVSYHPIVTLQGKFRPGGLFDAIFEVDCVGVKPPLKPAENPAPIWLYK